jgi:hypothetical protein
MDHEKLAQFTKAVADHQIPVNVRIWLSIFLFQINLFSWRGHAIYASASGRRSYSGSDIFTAQSRGIEKKEDILVCFKRLAFCASRTNGTLERSLSN